MPGEEEHHRIGGLRVLPQPPQPVDHIGRVGLEVALGTGHEELDVLGRKAAHRLQGGGEVLRILGRAAQGTDL